jgi:phage gpG-like protein
MANAKSIFMEIEAYLKSVQNKDKCSDDEVSAICDLYSGIFASLDIITSKLRLKYGELTEVDYEALQTALDNLRRLWHSADLPHTPKLHSLLSHTVNQMRLFGGIGDILEDDVEMMHQIAGRFEHRTARLKNPGMRALVHARMEAITHSKDVMHHVAQSLKRSKRKFKNRNTKLSKDHKAKRKKIERDTQRIATANDIQAKPFTKLITNYDKLKSKLKERKKG